MAAAFDPPAAEAITIVLADDHRLVRAAIAALLDHQEDVRVVEAVGDAAGALRSVGHHRPTVLVLDLGMPGRLEALDAIPLVRRESPGTSVVVLTMQNDPVFARRALKLGALGYVVKDAADAELVRAVRRAAAGERYVAAALAGAVAQSELALGPDGLTIREHDVLRLIALGHTNEAIAKELVLSVRTVESHRAHLQRKLRCRRRADLVRYALDHGMLAA